MTKLIYTPLVDDPDPPDYLTNDEITRLTDRIAELERRRKQPDRVADDAATKI